MQKQIAFAHLVAVEVGAQRASLPERLINRVPVLKPVIAPYALLQAEYWVDDDGCAFDNHTNYHAIDERNDAKHKEKFRDDVQTSHELEHYHGYLFAFVVVLKVRITTLELSHIVQPQLLRHVLVNVNARSVKCEQDLVYGRHRDVNQLVVGEFVQLQNVRAVLQ